MTASHSLLTVFAACSLLAAQASAQTVAAPAGPAERPVQQAPVEGRAAAAGATTVSAGLKLATALRGMATPHHTTTAAGSVLLLADGIVADARIAQVQSPAPGFQYER